MTTERCTAAEGAQPNERRSWARGGDAGGRAAAVGHAYAGARGRRALAEGRLHDVLGQMERDGDELLAEVADGTYADGGYPFDVV